MTNEQFARIYGLVIPEGFYLQEYPVEVQITSADTLKYTMQNNTNSLSDKIVVAVEIFTIDEQTRVNFSGRPNIAQEQYRELALYLNDDTNTQVLNGVPASSFNTASNNGILKLLYYVNINWPNSYLQFAKGSVPDPTTSVILNVHYLEQIKSSKTKDVLNLVRGKITFQALMTKWGK